MKNYSKSIIDNKSKEYGFKDKFFDKKKNMYIEYNINNCAIICFYIFQSRNRQFW
jgi:hypothetical protein